MKKISTLLLVCLTTLLHAQIPTNGLLQHFTFDSTLVNEDGTDTLAGGTGNYIAHGCGYAQSLTSTGYTFSNAGINGLPAGTAARSVAFWYKSETITTHSLFNYGLSNGYFGVVYDAGTANILVSGGTADLTAHYEDGVTWTHIAVTFGSGITNLYINGVMVASSNSIIFNTGVSPTTSRLGHSPFSGEYSGYSLDELLIYNRALTDIEVAAIYNTSLGGITVTQPPVLANSIVCLGDTIKLHVETTGDNLSYQWSENGNEITGATDSTLTYVAYKTGVTNLSVDITSSCATVTPAQVTANVYDYPTPTIVQTGALLQTQGYNTYQWRLNGVDIAGANGPDFTATQNGSYTVAVTRQDGVCEGVSPAVVLTSVGINEAVGFSTSIYPNPATEMLMIQCDEEIESMEIYNMLGEQITFVRGQVTKINVSGLNKALYSVRILTKSGHQAVRLFNKQ